MKKILVLFLFLGFGSCFAVADISLNEVSKIGDNYYIWDNNTQSYTRYEVRGNNIYGSDGSHYKRSGEQIIHDTAPQSNSYYINGTNIQQIRY